MTDSPVFATAPMGEYLADDEYVQLSDFGIRELARELRDRSGDDAAFTRAAFDWVRDEIGHSFDVSDPRVTLTAGEVLESRVGLCYAKSHLLAAVLRSEGIPTGFCYQRLTHGDGHVLHGLVAVYLNGSWHRQDPRGNKEGIDAQFSLEGERLAWQADPALGEVDYPEIFPTPAPCVIETLRGVTDILATYDDSLPTELPDSGLARPSAVPG